MVNRRLTHPLPNPPMPSLNLPDRLIWFAHCPKAGGTSVEQFLVDTFGDAVGHLHWGWDLWWKKGGWRQANPPNSPQHLIWEDALKVLPHPPDTVFAVVRDPLDRLISEYRYQRRMRRGTVLGRWMAHLPFSTWAGLMLAMAERNPYAFDNHLRPQSDFIPDHAHVFRLEAGLDPVTTWLSRNAAVPGPERIPHVLAGKTKMKTRLYSEDIVKIRMTYARDYERFGYCLPDLVNFPADPWPRVRQILIRSLLPIVLRLERCGNL